MMQERTRRSSSGRRLQMSLESSCGSMGTARSGKVDAGAAQAGFEIERGAGADV